MLSLRTMENSAIYTAGWSRKLVLLAAFFVSAASHAAEPVEPEVVITPRDGGQFKEYRIDGALYMIEVIPAKGPPYYLLDTDGDGVLETRRQNVEPDIVIPRWKIFSWK